MSSLKEGFPDKNAGPVGNTGSQSGGKEGLTLSKEREFQLVEQLAKIEGLVGGLIESNRTNTQNTEQRFVETIEIIKSVEYPIMAAKNNLEFHGRGNESATELIKALEKLTLANGWDEKKAVGQALATLQSEAKTWAHNLGVAAFKTEGREFKFEVFKTKFLAKFPSDINQSDLLYDVLALKQTRGESVDEYLTKVSEYLKKMVGVSEEVQCGMVVNGFLPFIRDNLKLKEVKTMADVYIWSRRLEKMGGVPKTTAVAAVEDLVEVDTLYTPPVKSPMTQNNDYYQQGAIPKTRNRITCFICNSPTHISWTCPEKHERYPEKRCFGCGSNLHIYSNCPGQSQYSPHQGSYGRGASFRGHRGGFRGNSRGGGYSSNGSAFRGAYRGRGTFRGGKAAYRGGREHHDLN